MANSKIRAELDIDGKDNTSPAFRSVATRIGGVEKQIAGFNRVAKDLGKTTAEVNRRLRDIEKTSQQVTRRSGAMAVATRDAFGTITRYAAPALLGAVAKKAVTDFASVEREMNRIGITAEATGEETSAAFAQMQTLSKQMAMPIDRAIAGLDTLVSSGMNLKEALAFLPSVLATAQATGAATEDIANTALKASSALKIQAGDMQRAFDIMVVGGKAGQFEAKDMAMYLPDLANSFASLGYNGEEGLKRLIAALQTIREDTGTAADAAVYMQNIMGKMNSQETVKNFSKFGINLNSEMKKAKKNGEDVLDAFTRLSNEAVKGDLSKLPLLFNDQQMRLGMQSLMTSTDRTAYFLKVVNGSKVDGTVFRDLNRVLGDTEASVDRLQSSWDKMWNSLGKSIAGPAVPVMDAISNSLDYGGAVKQGLDKKGVPWWKRGPISPTDENDDLAYQEGYRDPAWLEAYQKRRYERGVNKTSTGRQNMPIVISEFPGGDHHLNPLKLPMTGVPAPTGRPGNVPTVASGSAPNVHYWQDAQYQEGQRAMQAALMSRTEYYTPTAERTTPQHASELAGILNNLDDAAASGKANYRPYAPDTGAPDLKQNAEDASRAVAESGKQAGDSIKSGGESAAASMLAAARALVDAAERLSSVQIKMPSAFKPSVNADTGKSNTFATMPPGGGGGGGF